GLRFVTLSEFRPKEGGPEVPLGTDRSTAFVVALPVGERLPALQGVFQVGLLLWTEFRLRTDEMLDGVVRARSVIGQRFRFGFLSLEAIILGPAAQMLGPD